MSRYDLTWKRAARKEPRALPADVVARVVAATDSLAETPRPPGSRKLAGSEHAYRLRVGDYRIVYSLLDQTLVIEVVRVAHRSDVYRR